MRVPVGFAVSITGVFTWSGYMISKRKEFRYGVPAMSTAIRVNGHKSLEECAKALEEKIEAFIEEHGITDFYDTQD